MFYAVISAISQLSTRTERNFQSFVRISVSVVVVVVVAMIVVSFFFFSLLMFWREIIIFLWKKKKKMEKHFVEYIVFAVGLVGLVG